LDISRELLGEELDGITPVEGRKKKEVGKVFANP